MALESALGFFPFRAFFNEGCLDRPGLFRTMVLDEMGVGDIECSMGRREGVTG